MTTDLYNIFAQLPAQHIEFSAQFRSFLETQLGESIDAHWLNGTFPHNFVRPLGQFLHTHFPEEYRFPPVDSLPFRIMKLELGRFDPSMASFFAVHWGLAMGSIAMFGSEQQKNQWLPAMKSFQKIGSWALTEPLSGSDAASGLQTIATKTEQGWVLSGEKKWSGNASIADVIVIWARESDSRRMLGFLVEPHMPGVQIELLHDKIAKRAMENVLIRLDRVQLSEDQRLPHVEAFSHVSKQLIHGRVAVAWEALGIAIGVFEKALEYSTQRIQFGKPLAAKQLIQEKLVDMSEEITCMQALLWTLQQHEQHAPISSAQASLAKRACGRRARKVCQLARAVLGGNGILLSYGVARLFADMEAVFSYEGTDEINTLIVGRSLTGVSAF